MDRLSAEIKEIAQKANKKEDTQLDLVCFSHLRWDFVYQRPQHLLSRCARERRVFYIEEPVIDHSHTRLVTQQDETGVTVATPYLNDKLSNEQAKSLHVQLIDQLLREQQINRYIVWYYTPMALGYTGHLNPHLVIYDCMDELAAFKGAPSKMVEYENELLARADLVFTGGQSLYEAKKHRHKSVFPFPSSIEVEHFSQAREIKTDPEDQASIPHPRLGFFGVIDERFDKELIAEVADARPDWQIILIGPVAKIDPTSLPRRQNIHYLGRKTYKDLPKYLAGWDVALLPFAQNEATRFISPTKTPEYLAGGKPVVSTPIMDVVRPYGKKGLVAIAEGANEFVRAIEYELSQVENRFAWLGKVDKFLARISWDDTWKQMKQMINAKAEEKQEAFTYNLDNLRHPENHLPIPIEPLKPKPKKQNGHKDGRKTFDYLIVGAGFSGSVLAERLARGSGKHVLVIDRRPHTGGNAYDHYDEAGLLVHKYGPHIFHTNSREVFAYLSRFTQWRPYEHRVLASVDGQLLPIPINLDTVNRLYGLNLTSFELEKFFKSVAEPVETVKTSEDVVVNKVGRELYEKFFRNYTRKQWGLDPSELDASVTSRVPVRMNRDDRYFTDTLQAMPLHGYTQMFGNMLEHPNIRIMLNTDYRDILDHISYREMIFTGPIDEYFDNCYGKLPYRSLQFKFETVDERFRQPVAVINYPNEHLYTRSTEFKHLTGQEHHKTSLVYEYPCAEGDPYYPIPRPENMELFQKYKKRADSLRHTHFAGRLGTYRYYNMDQVTAQALTLYAKLSGKRRRESTMAHTDSRFTIELPCSLVYSPEME